MGSLNEKRQHALIIMAPITSHFIPSFYLSRELKKLNYSITYVVETIEDTRIIEKNGFKSIIISTGRFDRLENMSSSDNIREKTGLWEVIKYHLSLCGFHKRKEAVLQILEQVQPTIVFVDIFSSSDFLILAKHVQRIKVAFLSPMLSTHSRMGLSSIRDTTESAEKTNLKHWIIATFLEILPKLQRWIIIFKEGMVLKKWVWTKCNSKVAIFNNIPELLLAPIELEYSPKIKQKNQYYLGLCVDIERVMFDENSGYSTIKSFIINKKKNKKVIYVSFGTYFSTAQDFSRIASFLLALLEGIKNDTELIVIIVTNTQICNFVKDNIDFNENVYFFENVPQLDILSFSDLFITHGGLGSIKESIYFNVPMLVYPLDYNWDQNENGMKVDFHRLGLTGNIDKDEPVEIYDKIKRILKERVFYENIKQMNDSIGKNKFYSNEAFCAVLAKM